MGIDVDKLSDAEIGTKLVEFGYPMMPITGTTRKVLVKKLKLLIENQEKAGTSTRRSLGRYSSEEESDSDLKSKKNAAKNRRVTMAAPPSVNRSTTRTTVTLNNNKKSPIMPSVLRTSTSRTTSTKVSRSTHDDFDTGSDSEPEVIEVDDSPVNSYRRNISSSRIESPLYERKPMSYSTPKSPDITSDEASPSYLFNKPPTPPRYSTLPSTSTTSDSALERLNSIRSRLNLGNTDYEKRSTYTSSFNGNNQEPIETPFLSNFTHRLSQIRPNSPTTQEYGWRNDVIKEHDSNGSDATRQYTFGRLKPREPTRAQQLRNNSNVIRNNVVSFLVLGVAVLFFMIVGIMYLSMRSGENALETSGYRVPLCTTESQRHAIDCINKTDYENTTKFLNTLKPHLAKRALIYACNGIGVNSYMTEPEVINYYHKLSELDIRKVQQQLHLLEVLIFNNPEWEISIVHVDETEEMYEKNIINDMDEVIALRPSKTIALVVLYPDVPWRCVLYNKMYSIFKTLLVLTAGFFILWLINYSLKYYKTYKQGQKDTVINIAKQIIDILQSNTTEDSNSFVVINHVRDMILPINDRARMEKLWDQAVKFINENESRIRTEIQVVKGEPFEVWRWISSSSTSRSKTWQGQAFETQVGSVNSLPCSPTSCLKIRGMLDDAEQTATIQDAVLSKCAHQCKILHCSVDTSSKCVYLKCADQTEAAIAYRSLHGWWYAGHLVTVKYLRVERYMQRFPNSPASGPPFLKSESPATDWSN